MCCSEKEYVTFKNELILQEDALKKQLHQQKAEIQQLNVEKESLNSVVQHANLRIEELEELTASLHKEVDELHHACDNSSLFINKELENVRKQLYSNSLFEIILWSLCEICVLFRHTRSYRVSWKARCGRNSTIGTSTRRRTSRTNNCCLSSCRRVCSCRPYSSIRPVHQWTSCDLFCDCVSCEVLFNDLL